MHVEGVVLSPEYKISPITLSGLEIILKARFTIAEVKSKHLYHLKELIKEYYEPVTNILQSDNGKNYINIMEQHSEEKREENLEMY